MIKNLLFKKILELDSFIVQFYLVFKEKKIFMLKQVVEKYLKFFNNVNIIFKFKFDKNRSKIEYRKLI